MARTRPYAAIAAVSIALMTARVEAADPDAQAREHYERALQHYSQRDYASALQELQRTAELRPHYRLHRSLAQVHAAMRDYAAAYTENRLYLEQAGDKITPERRQEVTDEMTTLARLVAMVLVDVNVPGSVVQVDGANLGRTPLPTPFALNVGPHQVVVSHPRYPSQSKQITALAGGSERLEFWLGNPHQTASPSDASFPAVADGQLDAPVAEAQRPFVDPAFAPPVDSKHGDSTDYLWLGWVATGVLAAGATATGLWALLDNDSLASERRLAESQGSGASDELDSHASRLRALATVTDALWVAAVAAGGVTLWFTLDSRKSEQQAASQRLVLQGGVGPEGVSLRARF